MFMFLAIRYKAVDTQAILTDAVRVAMQSEALGAAGNPLMGAVPDKEDPVCLFSESEPDGTGGSRETADDSQHSTFTVRSSLPQPCGCLHEPY